MKKLFLPVLIATSLALGPVTQAYARPDVRKMTCDQVKQMTRTKGAVVYTFTKYTYDRVVKNSFYCSRWDEKTENVIVKTRDNNRCNIGKRCTGEFRDFRDDF